MRMWMVNPQIFCPKHASGQHVEIHMAIGSCLKGTPPIERWIDKDLLEPLSFKYYHDLVAKRLKNHKTPLSQETFLKACSTLLGVHLRHKIDRKASLQELLRRCPACRKNYQQITGIKYIRTK